MGERRTATVTQLPVESYYETLNLKLGTNQKTGQPVLPSIPVTIRNAWRKALVDAHSDLHPPDEADFQARRFRAVMEAGLCLMNTASRELYEEHFTSEAGHAGWARSPHREPYDVDELPDWLVILVDDLAEDALCSRGDHADTQTAMRSVNVSGVPPYVPGERLLGVAGLDLGQLMVEVLDAHGTVFFDLRLWLKKHPGGLTWTWRRKGWSVQGAPAVGKARKLSDKDRAHMPGNDATRPWGEIQVALNYWLVADEEERRRLIFHELMHFAIEDKKLKTRGHTIETFAEEMAAFGVRDAEQAELVAEAIRHEATAERVEHYGVLPNDQIVLFREFFTNARALSAS